MKLADYIQGMSDEELDRFAKKAQTSSAYIKQLATGFRKAGVKSIYNIEKATGKKVTASDLRPDLGKTNSKNTATA